MPKPSRATLGTVVALGAAPSGFAGFGAVTVTWCGVATTRCGCTTAGALTGRGFAGFAGLGAGLARLGAGSLVACSGLGSALCFGLAAWRCWGLAAGACGCS